MSQRDSSMQIKMEFEEFKGSALCIEASSLAIRFVRSLLDDEQGLMFRSS